jgi:hypothetical protein
LGACRDETNPVVWSQLRMPETSVSLDKDNIAIPSCFLLLTWVATRAVFSSSKEAEALKKE